MLGGLGGQVGIKRIKGSVIMELFDIDDDGNDGEHDEHGDANDGFGRANSPDMFFRLISHGSVPRSLLDQRLAGQC